MKTGYFFIIKNNTSRGKDLAQILHAGEKLYKKEGETNRKIVYKISVEESLELVSILKRNKYNYYEIKDAGKTQVEVGTKTVICLSAIEEINLFSKYKLY